MNRKSYPSDLTEIEPILSENVYLKAGSKEKYPRKEMFNAISRKKSKNMM